MLTTISVMAILMFVHWNQSRALAPGESPSRTFQSLWRTLEEEVTFLTYLIFIETRVFTISITNIKLWCRLRTNEISWPDISIIVENFQSLWRTFNHCRERSRRKLLSSMLSSSLSAPAPSSSFSLSTSPLSTV